MSRSTEAPVTVDGQASTVAAGVMILRDGVPSWRNDAADALLARAGMSWDDPTSLEPLAAVEPGRRAVPVHVGTDTGWLVSCQKLDTEPTLLLYEIVEDARVDVSLTPAAATRQLDRLHAVAGVGSWTWDVRADVLEWSEPMLARFDLPSGTTLTFAEYCSRLLHPDDVPALEGEVAAAMRELRPFAVTHRMFVGPARAERMFECHGEVFPDSSGTPVRLLGTTRDITVQHRAQQELAYLATHDPLTGIPNRQRFTSRLTELGNHPDGATVLLIDIDNIADVNVLHGPAVGDRVIRHVADRLLAELGEQGELSRLGGDEFALVIPAGDVEGGLRLAGRLCAAVAASPLQDSVGMLWVTISIGVAGAVHDVESGLARADLALHTAKRAGRNRVRRYTDELYASAVHRVSLLLRVQRALDENLMQLDAQPIVELASGRVSRYELLIRLRDGNDPPLGPVDFLPVVERTDLMLRLDRWVLDRAIRELATPRARERGLRLEVNVSARSLDDPELGSWILAELESANVPPRWLGLEITETAAIRSVAAARSLATRLTAAGCGFTLDDFGSGFGSFTYLKHLPFSAVKIAGEFVRHLDRDRVDGAMVAAVVGVAKQLGMRTVAEQVDREPLVSRLRAAGVDDGQGFHLGRPVPLPIA